MHKGLSKVYAATREENMSAFVSADAMNQGMDDMDAEMLHSLQKKFRTKRDLYSYLDQHCK